MSESAPSDGWFELRQPRDLLAKLRHDLQRIQRDSSDSFAAFDFFVTAWQLLDWVHPGKQNERLRAETVKGDDVLAVCQHVATGAKHFKVESRHAKSVRATGQRGTFDRTFDATFERVHLVLHLDGRSAEVFGPTVEVADFAARVVDWWAQRLGDAEQGCRA
jgi:hypothetical protein